VPRSTVYLEDMLDQLRPMLPDDLMQQVRRHARAKAGAESRHRGRAASPLEEAGVRRLVFAPARDLTDETVDHLQAVHDRLHEIDRAGGPGRLLRARAHARIVRALERRGRDHTPRSGLDFAGLSPEPLDDLQKAAHVAALDDGDLLRAHRALHVAWPAGEALPRAVDSLRLDGVVTGAWVAHGYQTGIVKKANGGPVRWPGQGWAGVISDPADLGGPRLLWGLARLGPAREIDLLEFDRLRDRHRIEKGDGGFGGPRRRHGTQYADVLEALPFEAPVPVEAQRTVWVPDTARVAQPFGPLDGSGLRLLLAAHRTVEAEIRKRELLDLDGDRMTAIAKAAYDDVVADLEAHFGTILASPSVPPDIRDAIHEFLRGPETATPTQDLAPNDPNAADPTGNGDEKPLEPVPGLAAGGRFPVRRPTDPEEPEARPYPRGPAPGGPVRNLKVTDKSAPGLAEVHVNRPLRRVSIGYMMRWDDTETDPLAPDQGGIALEKPGLEETAAEFRWRLRDPSKLDIVGQRVITTDPHPIRALFGKPHGKKTTVMEGLRFPKPAWTADAVRAYLDAHPDLRSARAQKAGTDKQWHYEEPSEAFRQTDVGRAEELLGRGRRKQDDLPTRLGPNMRPTPGGGLERTGGGPLSRYPDEDITRIAPPVREFLDELAKADGGPTVLDYLTSRLHDGYARSADAVYALGHLTQPQRKAVGESVGRALKTYRDSLRELCGPDVMGKVIPSEDVRAALQKAVDDYEHRTAAIHRAATAERVLPFLKADDEKHEIYCVVMEPGLVDTQGDVYDEDMVQEACHDFLANWRTIEGGKWERGLGEQHKGPARSVDLIECYCTPQALKLGQQALPKGTWVVGLKVNSNALWRDVKAGKYTGLSIGGYGEGRPATDQEVARLTSDRSEQVKAIHAAADPLAKDGRGTKRHLLTKREVGYVPIGTDPRTICVGCAMYNEADHAQDGSGQGWCSLLARAEGTVNAGGHCNQFEPAADD